MATVSSQSFGDLLRRYRLAAGLTQEELADQAGLSVRGLSDLERGARRAPRRETVQLLAEALHLPAAERTRLEAAARQRGVPAVQAPGGSWSSPANSAAALPFVGRAQELALLDQLLADGPPVLLVAGEPGIGKSRLLQAGIEAAEAHGWTVLAGGCHRRSGQDPYAPLVNALVDSLQRQSPAQQQLQLQGCAWLVRLLPELADSGVVSRPTWTLPSEQERRLMFSAVARYLTNVAGPAGTLLVLDDLHWAGSDVLDLLQALVRAPAERPLRILGAYRDTDIGQGDPLALLAADLTREGRASHAQLSPLAEAEATDLLVQLLPGTADEEPHLRQQVLERAGGVPLFLVSCVQALLTGALTWNGSSHVPWTLREAILQRAVTLPVTAQQVLRLAAVVGRRVPRVLLVAVAEKASLGVEMVPEALEECSRARLLAEAGEDAYQFTHDLIREVLLLDLGMARRALLHRRVAEALEQGPGIPSVEVLAYHYARAEDEEKAVIYLQAAGDAALARHANAEAAAAYREVVTRLEKLGRTLEAASWREKLGDVLILLTQYDEALAVQEQVCETYRQAGDLESELRTLAKVGRTHRWRGTSAEGLAHLLPLRKALPKRDASPGAAAFSIALAYLYAGACQFSEMLEATEQAVTLARAVGDEQMLLAGQERRGAALFLLGRLEEARQVLTNEVIPVAEATGNLWLLIDALDNLGVVYDTMGEFRQGQAYQERAMALALRQGGLGQMAYLTYEHGLTAFFQGNWKQARADFEQAVSLGASAGRSWNTAYPSYGLFLLALLAGQQEARGALEEAVVQAERNHDLRVVCWLKGMLAEDDLLAHRPETARARLASLLELIKPEVIDFKEVLPLLAWAELESGDVPQAQARLEGLIAIARQERMRPILVDALRVQALAWSRQDRWAEAEAVLEEALGICRSMRSPYAEAKTLYVSGLVFQQKKELAPARQGFQATLTILEHLGEGLYARHVEQLLGQEEHQ
jgi:tetratricopeptide (TPR) repeat protein/transcriptional regulator with XRE-family HTH domain